MTLNLEVSEYIPDLDLGAGARILVHDQYTMPFVDTDGVSLSPATETSIGVKKVMRFEINNPNEKQLLYCNPHTFKFLGFINHYMTYFLYSEMFWLGCLPKG